MNRRVWITLALAAALAACSMGQPKGPLDEYAMQDTFGKGATIKYSGAKGDGTLVLFGDKTASLEQGTSGQFEDGTWAIQGATLCVKWKTMGEMCTTHVRTGDNQYEAKGTDGSVMKYSIQ